MSPKVILVLGLGDGFENQESGNWEFWASQIMTSEFYCTNLKQINPWKFLNLIFKHIFHINGTKMAIIIPIIRPVIFL